MIRNSITYTHNSAFFDCCACHVSEYQHARYVIKQKYADKCKASYLILLFNNCLIFKSDSIFLYKLSYFEQLTRRMVRDTFIETDNQCQRERECVCVYVIEFRIMFIPLFLYLSIPLSVSLSYLLINFSVHSFFFVSCFLSK